MSVILILALAAPAPAADCEPVSLGPLAARAVELVIEDELDAATREAWRGLGALDCTEEVPRPEDLATLWQVLGAVEVYRGELALADDHLARAAAVNPGWFDDRLGQDVQEVWSLVSAAAVASAGISAWPLPEGAVLYLDGVVRPATPVELIPGRHLVQVVWDGELAFQLVLELEDGQRAELATGLPEPQIARRGPSPWLIGAGVAALGAAGSYAAAVRLDRSLTERTTVEELDADYLRTRQLGYGLAGGLGGLAALGLGVHIAIW